MFGFLVVVVVEILVIVAITSTATTTTRNPKVADKYYGNVNLFRCID